MKDYKFYILFYVIFFIETVCSISPSDNQDARRSVELPPCKACNALVNAVQKAARNKKAKDLDDGAKLQFILANTCDDIIRSQHQCYVLRDLHAAHIAEHYKLDYVAFFEMLCIEKLKVCCPQDHYGPNCEKCLNCHPYGQCKGDGTRKGNGKCSCNEGYTGNECKECAVTYYEVYRERSMLMCSKCYVACGEEGCTSGGAKGCLTCKPGWRMDPDSGCNDINECLETRNICTAQQFCVNNDGSHSCLECDRSCIGCDGDGPDMCKSCAEGYTLVEGKCTDDSVEQREQYANMTRLLTYFGLCIATCVIFQSSTTKAYVVGAAVATYIAASEYWLNTTPAPADLKSQLNSKKLEDLIMNLL